MTQNIELLGMLHESHFQLITRFFLEASEKNKASEEKAAPYLQACKENYVYNSCLKMELREAKKKISEVRGEYLDEITALREENDRLKKTLKLVNTK